MTSARMLTSRFFVLACALLALSSCRERTSPESAQEDLPQAPAVAAPSMPWQDPTYDTDTSATRAESRPGPEETPDSWPLWIKHHEDRKRWTTENPVDLLMVGDSIVFGWSRVGKPVWDAYYADRNAVNIGSSGDRTYHMLWHFQNGGLDGMKDRNPKVVLVMIGTNNRGEPEAKGEDTAYGILALLKEIHAKLPESKICLMPIFPRGRTPEDEGRRRNEEINNIIKTYADNQTVHWLDIGHVFLDDQGNLKADLMPDALHPNLDGYWAWAEAMEPALSKLIGVPARTIERPSMVFDPVPQPAQLGRNDLPNPDFTQGGTLPEENVKDWNLGATGARGWMYNIRMHTNLARQIYITQVAPGTPADGQLQKGDVLLGIADAPFTSEPRQQLGQALTAAEATDGNLRLIRWRDGQIEKITLQIPVLGTYSPTAPHDCPKSEIILNAAVEKLAERMAQPGYERQNPIPRALNAIGLLATGDSKYHPLIKKEAEWAADFSIDSMATWYYGYLSLFLSEYILATGDNSVLPGLRRIAMEAANGQSAVGSWGHKFALPDGRLPGYGMMHSPGIVLTTGLVLAREAGVNDPEVKTAIDRSATMLRFYIGKGAIPYGDHAPWGNTHEDNGKCSMASVLFDQMQDHEGAEFFAKMSTAAHSSIRDQGHTGNFFNIAWAMPGVAPGGPHATGQWMREYGAWYFDLARQPDMTFPHQGPPQNKNDSYAAWDATGTYLIAYAMPRKAIRLTGSRTPTIAAWSLEEARQLVANGRGVIGNEPYTAYDDLPPDTLLAYLDSWSPAVRTWAAAAICKKKSVPVAQLIALLESPSINARLGACEALSHYGKDAEPALSALFKSLDSDHLWLRIQAAETFSKLGEHAMPAVPYLLRRIARGPTAEDPRGMEQRHLIQALFHHRTGMLGRSLDGVDQDLLLAAVQAGLQNQDGAARGAFSSVYQNLTLDQLRPILPVIHRAIIEKSPSGEMFCGTIQMAGLDLFSRNLVSEGIELIADYTYLQKGHGSQIRIDQILNMLKRYGAHAQRAIPNLEKAIHFFEHEEKDFPRNLSLEKAEKTRQAIAEIQQSTDRPELIRLGR